jgi:hypothetical protein
MAPDHHRSVIFEDNFLNRFVEDPLSWLSSPRAQIVRLSAMLRTTKISIADKELAFRTSLRIREHVFDFWGYRKHFDSATPPELPTNPFKGQMDGYGGNNPVRSRVLIQARFKIPCPFCTHPFNRKTGQAIQSPLVLIHDSEGGVRIFLIERFNGPCAKVARTDDEI